jgi:mycothiol synthase
MRRPDLEGLPELSELPQGYELRLLLPGDEAGVASLMARAFDDSAWTADRVLTDLAHDPTVHKTFVIVCGDRPVATASAQLLPDCRPGTGVLHWVASDPVHRGMRLGRIVSLAVLLEFFALGLRDAVLLTDDDRLPAIRTYLGLGFFPECIDDTHPARWEAAMAKIGAKNP